MLVSISAKLGTGIAILIQRHCPPDSTRPTSVSQMEPTDNTIGHGGNHGSSNHTLIPWLFVIQGMVRRNWQWSGLALRQWWKDDHPVLDSSGVLSYSSNFYGLPFERWYGNGNRDPPVFNSRHYLLRDLISLIRSIVPYLLRCFCFEWFGVGKWEVIIAVRYGVLIETFTFSMSNWRARDWTYWREVVTFR